MKIKSFQALYPFEGYVIESVNCPGVGIQFILRWDAPTPPPQTRPSGLRVSDGQMSGEASRRLRPALWGRAGGFRLLSIDPGILFALRESSQEADEGVLLVRITAGWGGRRQRQSLSRSPPKRSMRNHQFRAKAPQGEISSTFGKYVR